MTDAQDGFFFTKFFRQLMIRTGKNIHPVHVRRLGYKPAPVAEFLTTCPFHHLIDTAPYKAVCAGQTR